MSPPGECSGPSPDTELLMFEGNGDNSGSDPVQACYQACFAENSPLGNYDPPRSWATSGSPAKGFIIAASGRCFCEFEEFDSAACNGVQNTDLYTRYDLEVAAVCLSEFEVFDNAGEKLSPTVSWCGSDSTAQCSDGDLDTFCQSDSCAGRPWLRLDLGDWRLPHMKSPWVLSRENFVSFIILPFGNYYCLFFLLNINNIYG